jgi:tetratricopeptide (TPR) repeat protein
MNVSFALKFKQCQEHLKDGDFQEALELCNELLEDDTGGLVFHLQGIALYYLGRMHEAIFAFTQATQYDEASVEAWSYLALIHLEMLNLEQAKIAILRASQITPYHADTWALRTIYREWQQDFSGADRAYAHAHWLSPDVIPKLSPFKQDEALENIKKSLREQSIYWEQFDSCISIQYQTAPTLPQLKANQTYMSSLFLSFHLETHPEKAILIGFEKNIQRGLAEDISIEEQLSHLFPQIKDYLDTWYQRQP